LWGVVGWLCSWRIENFTDQGKLAAPIFLRGGINGLVKCNGSATYSAVADNSTNWNVACGWGNHATAGYLKTESDPQVSSVTANLKSCYLFIAA
jgi:hypothetical protein